MLQVCCLEGQLERHLQLKKVRSFEFLLFVFMITVFVFVVVVVKALEAHIVFQSSILMLAQNSLTGTVALLVVCKLIVTVVI